MLLITGIVIFIYIRISEGQLLCVQNNQRDKLRCRASTINIKEVYPDDGRFHIIPLSNNSGEVINCTIANRTDMICTGNLAKLPKSFSLDYIKYASLLPPTTPTTKAPLIHRAPQNLILRDTKNCRDSHPRCHTRMKRGECEINKRYMWFMCQKSCKTCVPSINDNAGLRQPVCQNDHPKCHIWTMLYHECYSVPWTKKNCRYSCRLCS